MAIEANITKGTERKIIPPTNETPEEKINRYGDDIQQSQENLLKKKRRLQELEKEILNNQNTLYYTKNPIKKLLLPKKNERLQEEIARISYEQKALKAFMEDRKELIEITHTQMGNSTLRQPKAETIEKESGKNLKGHKDKTIGEIMKILDVQESSTREKVRELSEKKQSIFKTFSKWTSNISYNAKLLLVLSGVVAGGSFALKTATENDKVSKPNPMTYSSNQKTNDLGNKVIDYTRPQYKIEEKENQDAILRKGEGPEHAIKRQIVNNLELAKKLGFKDGGDIKEFAEKMAHEIFSDSGITRKKFAVGEVFEVLVGNTGKATLKAKESPVGKIKTLEKNRLPSISYKAPPKQNTYRPFVEIPQKQEIDPIKLKKSENDTVMTPSQAEEIVNNITNGTIVIYGNKEYEVGLPLTAIYGKGNYRLLTGKINKKSGMKISKDMSREKLLKLIQSGEITLKPKAPTLKNETIKNTEQDIEEKTKIAQKKLTEFIIQKGWAELVKRGFDDIGTVEDTFTDAQKEEFKKFVQTMMKLGYRKANPKEKIQELLEDCVRVIIVEQKEDQLYKLLTYTRQ